jgi:hypothetical protein
MKKGDLVKVAQRFSGGFWGTPVFSKETDAVGIVLELGNVAPDALVLIDGHPTWVVLKNLEVINEAR